MPTSYQQLSVFSDQSHSAQNNRSRKIPLFTDPLLLGITGALLVVSLVMVYSTTGVVAQEHFGDALYYVKRQGMAELAGLVALMLASRIKIDFVKKISPFLLPIALLLLIGTLLPGIGDSAGGAKRWVVLGGFRFQPGEFVKLMVIIFMAGYFGRHESTVMSFLDGIFKPLLIVAVVCGLFLVQPDFGSSAIIAAVTLAMATASGARLRYIFGGLGALILAGGLLVVISPYRMSRIMSFLSPGSDPAGKGYQLIQSLIAVGTGNISGVGLGGSQQKLFFLPAAHTDFIFAVIAEEFGFIGCLAVIGLFLMLLWRGFVLASRVADDTFSFALSVGLILLVVFPALVNIGVVTGILPTKGLVLPLVGYGGSSLVASLAGIGLLLGVAREHQKELHS